MFAIYPERREWSEERIRLALADAVANDEVDTIGGVPFDAATVSLALACELLANTGKVTWGKCDHNSMVERAGDTSHAWECADCGYVYGQDNSVQDIPRVPRGWA